MDPEFDGTVADEDLQALERRYLEERRGGAVSQRSQFELGWGLVRSRDRGDVARGVALLQELMPKGTREEQRDISYYLALGHYRLKDYERALGHLEPLLTLEPQNPQGLRLRRHIRERLGREGLLGAAIVGGVALGVAGLLGLLVTRGRR